MGFVHITSGRLKGRKIRTPSGYGTRPLLTRLRKSLADILRPKLAGARVLDLFGGSGAITFELLSNGAVSAVVVEISIDASELICLNARSLGVEPDVEIHGIDSVKAVNMLSGKDDEFDIIIIAPPYGLGLQQKLLDNLGKHKLLKKQGVVIVQREAKEPVPEQTGRLGRVRTRHYGRTVFDFFEEIQS
jgi:16S rRNA (guanine966-N2)-methyltransferase